MDDSGVGRRAVSLWACRALGFKRPRKTAGGSDALALPGNGRIGHVEYHFGHFDSRLLRRRDHHFCCIICCGRCCCWFVDILDFSLAALVLVVRSYRHTDHYWQVYFDTNKVIRESFGAAGFPVPEQYLAIRNQTGNGVNP